MYPVIRLITFLTRASFGSPLALSAQSETSFRCRPWDIDLFMEVNNGRILTLYDLGRFDLVVRSGFGKVMQRQGWGLVVAGASVRYRRRMRMFNKITMRTQLVAIDERWIYLVQSMWVKGQPASSMLVRTGVTEQGRVVPTARIAQVMGLSADWLPEPDGWIKDWINADDGRDWPP